MCKKKLKRFKVSYDKYKEVHKTNIQKVFDIDVTGDNPHVHPPNFCYACYNVIKQHQKAIEQGRHFKHQVDVFKELGTAVAFRRPNNMNHPHYPKEISTHTHLLHT